MSTPPILSQIMGDSARARKADPETSHAAADSITAEGREASEVEVLEILRSATEPVTAERIEARHATRALRGESAGAWTGQRLRTALKQLVEDGYVVQDGEGRTRRGRRALTWRLAGERGTR